jgi:hypothetical protein
MNETEFPEQRSNFEAAGFDYAALELEIRICVQQHTQQIKTLMRRSAQDIIEIGQKLIEVKEKLGHGCFETWLRAEFNWSEWTARKFMQVTRQFKTVNLTDLNIATTALYILASDSTPDGARREALKRATQGEIINPPKAKAIVERYRQEAKSKITKPATVAPPSETIDGELLAESKTMAASTSYPPTVNPALVEQSIEHQLGKEKEPEFSLGDAQLNLPEMDDYPITPESVNTFTIYSRLVNYVELFSNEQVAFLCSKCLASMDEGEQDFERINFEGLSDSTLKLLIQKSERELSHRHSTGHLRRCFDSGSN